MKTSDLTGKDLDYWVAHANNYRPKTYFTEVQAKEINRRNKDIMTENGKAQLRARNGAADHKAAIELGLTITEYYKSMGVVCRMKN